MATSYASPPQAPAPHWATGPTRSRRNLFFPAAALVLLCAILIAVISFGIANRSSGPAAALPAEPAASAEQTAAAKQLTCNAWLVSSYTASATAAEAKPNDPTWNSTLNPRISSAVSSALATLDGTTPSKLKAEVRTWAGEWMKYSTFYAKQQVGTFDTTGIKSATAVLNSTCGFPSN